VGNKNRNRIQLNWQATTPVPFVPNTPLSGNLTGTMASTNTIYSNIMDVTIKDNIGLEITWTGNPTGTISVYGSVSGINFYAITFNPVLTQPAGSAGGYLISLNQWPWYYVYVGYTNASGNGVLTVWQADKDLN
jgi:hypothetical protein